MKIGYAFGPTNEKTILRAAASGCDYVELVLCDMVNQTAEELEKQAALLKANSLPVGALICMLPGDLPVTGPDFDLEKCKAYVDAAFASAAVFGAKRVVFGSTGARRIKEGETRKTALAQVTAFVKEALLPALEKYDLTCVLEPLSDDNLFPTLADGDEFVKSIGHARFGLLADFYHVGVMKEDLESEPYLGYSLLHTHVASPSNGRKTPLADDGDEAFYRASFAYLKKIGFKGNMSFEGNLPPDAPEAALSASIAYLKALSREFDL
ncbi:MAG: sugar phosphate isomerase/epimerase [Clostridia bacterium]|nr:sugar phosphate isomerase/epimerase [Clostridia bacterium]